MLKRAAALDSAEHCSTERQLLPQMQSSNLKWGEHMLNGYQHSSCQAPHTCQCLQDVDNSSTHSATQQPQEPDTPKLQVCFASVLPSVRVQIPASCCLLARISCCALDLVFALHAAIERAATERAATKAAGVDFLRKCVQMHQSQSKQPYACACRLSRCLAAGLSCLQMRACWQQA